MPRQLCSARLLAALAPLALLSACGDAADPVKAREEQHAAVSRPDERLPEGFSLYVGNQGAREFEIMDVPTGGQIATFSVVARPVDVIAFYEEEATRAGMSYAGRLNTGDLLSYEARKEAGSPRTFGVSAHDKGPHTNVSLSFDVTP